MLLRSAVGRFVNRVIISPAAIFVPMFDAMLPRHNNVLAVLDGPRGKFLIPAHNIVGDAGDIHYAEMGVGATPTNVFGVHEMQSAGTPAKGADRSDFTAIASTEKAHTATYPKVNDGDADNTGAGVDIATFLATYAKGDFNHSAITHGIITNATPGASEPILTGYAFTSFEKTADDTLKVFVNHEFTGS